MLKQMRSQTKRLRPILWLILASFLGGFVFMVQGGAGEATSPGRDFAAEVGSRTIAVEELQSALQRQDNYLRQILGQNYSPSFLNAESVLDNLVDRAVMLNEADRLGLVTTPEQVAAELRSIKGLQDEAGHFDREVYESYLQMQRLRPTDFESQLSDDLKLMALNDVLRGGVTLTDGEIKDAWLKDNETASIEYVTVPLAGHEGSVNPTEEELRAHYQQHQVDFDGGPARNVQIVRFSREKFQSALEKEEDMRKYYDENVEAIYTMTDAQRRASLVLVAMPAGSDDAAKAALRAKADEVANRARGGADFAALAMEASDDAATKAAGGDLGPFYQGSLEAPVDAAVFAAAQGDVVGPIETSRGFEILKVTKGAGVLARPFEDVRSLVARGLYARDAAEALDNAVKKFKEAQAAKADLAASAAAAGVTVSEPVWITRTGDIPGIGPNPVASEEAFRLDVGGVSEALSEPGGQIIISVLEKRENSPRAFEDARVDVLTAVRTVRARELAKADAEAIRSAVAGGATLATAAPGQSPQTAGPFARGASIPGLSAAPDVVKAAFETEAGQVGRLADASDAVVVFRVTERTPFDQAKFDEGKAALGRRVRDQRFQSLHQDTLLRLRKSYEGKITINDSVLAPFQQRPSG